MQSNVIQLNENLTDEFNVRGRGKILYLNSQDYPEVIFEAGMQVQYLGTTYKILNIEKAIILTSPPRQDKMIGLLVVGT